MHAAWNLEPQLSTVVAATLVLLALVLAASLTVGVAELLARRPPRPGDPFGRRAGAPARRFYVGRLERSEPSVFVVDSAVRPLAHAGPGPRRFGWGSVDQGGLHLAHSVLRDVGSADPAPDQVHRFLGEVVKRLPDEGFVLAAEHVQGWLHAQRRRRGRTGAAVRRRQQRGEVDGRAALHDSTSGKRRER